MLMHEPDQCPSFLRPQPRSIRTSVSAKGIQSMPRSRSQACKASPQRGLPGKFSYEITRTHSCVSAMVYMIEEA
jgi:hypothetical protein